MVFSLVHHQNCPVSWPAACASETLAARQHRRVEVQLRGVGAHRLQRLLQRFIVKVLVPQSVALVPGVRDEVLGQVMLRDVYFGRAHQVHVPLVEVVQGLQARESNRKEHVAQESLRPGLVKDMFADTLKTVRARILRICDSACLNFCAFPRVPAVKRQYPTVLQNVKSFRWMLVCEWMDCLVSTSGPW